jgi:hypothetical protein
MAYSVNGINILPSCNFTHNGQAISHYEHEGVEVWRKAIDEQLGAGGPCALIANSTGYNEYTASYTIPEGWTQATITYFNINIYTYGDTTGWLYYDGKEIGSKTGTYYGNGTHGASGGISVPKTISVSKGKKITVKVRGWTNAGVMSVNQNCSVGVHFTLT